ncbi:class I SAM-dependent methyltransferase [Cognatishimia sp. F0-27]|nr:class I SAM-dependent methyltransferase [Cognatishimia sp. F0-27]
MSGSQSDPPGTALGHPGLPEETRAVYERHAEGFDRHRSRAFFEARWLARFARDLPRGGRVLDLGCGSGQPISAWLIGEGFRLTGVDYAGAMLDIARRRWPDGDWRQGDMRFLDLPERFDGIVGWNSFFHLTPDEQRACLPRLAKHLGPGGVLMVTVGPMAGEVTGTVQGETVYHASLSPADYAASLEKAGMRMSAFLADDPDCAGHSILMGIKL